MMKKFGPIQKYALSLTWTMIIYIVYVAGASAQVAKESDRQLEGIDVIEKLGDTIPLDMTFVDDKGDSVTLGKYFNQGKPVLLMMGYYECPMLCNLVFNGMVAAGHDLEYSPGIEYNIVSVSINPNENYELAAAKKHNYLVALEKPTAEDGWAFLTGDSTQSRRLANALGFQYYYVEDQQQYAHPAVLFLLSPDGKISRYLYGIEYKVKDLKLGILEASEGKVGNTLDRIVLYCFHYDPNAGSYTIFAGNVMRLGGVVTVILLTLLIVALFIKERRKNRKLPVNTVKL